MIGCVYSCKFLQPYRKPALPGSSVEAIVGLTISTHKGILLELSKSEFDKLRSQGEYYNLEEARGDTFPYRLRLGGNILSVKLKK